jgi:hypothetical protein
MHGPPVIVEGKVRKSFLFAFLDDHSRLIPHGEFYLQENLKNLTDCLIKVSSTRPRHRLSWDLPHSLHPLSPRREGKNRKVFQDLENAVSSPSSALPISDRPQRTVRKVV